VPVTPYQQLQGDNNMSQIVLVVVLLTKNHLRLIQHLLGRLDDIRMNFVKVMEEEAVEIEELSNMMTMHDFLVVVIDLAFVEGSFVH